MSLLENQNISETVTTDYVQLIFWLLLLNCLIWVPALWIDFPTIGLGHDSQIFTAAIHSELRAENGFLSMSPKLLAAREDIYSYPYFGIMYPFYFTFGLTETFSYKSNLILDFASVAFHMVMASVTFTLLLKRMNCSSSVSIVFGLFYGYSLHLKMWSSWIWALSGYAWIPLCLLGIWETVHNRRYRLGMICMSLGFGFIALGTALPLVYALILAAGFFFFCILKVRPDRPDLYKALFCIFLASLVSVAIGASHMLPTLHQTSEYVRWYSGGALIGSLKPPYEGTLATVLEFSIDGLKQFVFPTKWYGVGHPFVGLSLLMFSMYYVIINLGRRYIYPMLFLGAYFLFDAFGDSTFVHRVTYSIPLINSVRYPLANIYITHTVLLLFAALGVSTLLKAKTKRRYLLVAFFGASSAIGASILWAYQSQLISGLRELHFGWLLAVVFSGCLAVVASNSRYWKVCTLLAVAAMLPLNSMLVHPKIPKMNSLYIGCDDFSEIEFDLRAVRSKIKGTPRFATYAGLNFKADPSSCLSKRKLSPQLMNSVAMIAGWDVMQMYLSPRAIREFRLFNRLSSQYRAFDHDAFLRAGVTHILLPKGYELLNEHQKVLTFVAEIGPYPLYVIKDSILGQPSIGCIDVKRPSNAVSFKSTDGVREVQGLPLNLLNDASYRCQETLSRVTKIVRRGSKLTYQITDSTTNSIFISDQVFNGAWRALVNGETVEAFAVDGYRLAVAVPSGASSVELAYRPNVFLIGVISTIFGFSAVLVIVFTFVFKKSYSRLKGRLIKTLDFEFCEHSGRPTCNQKP